MTRREERELLVACVIGDGCLVRHAQQGSVWLKLTHAAVQKDYLLWKCSQIEATRIVKGKRFTIRDRTSKHSNGKHYKIVTANMYGVSYFHTLRGWLYPGGRKSWARGLRFMETPLALAVLFMDDGCAHRRRRKHRDGTAYCLAPRMSLAVFRSEAECLEVLAWLAVRFGVQGYTERRRASDGSFQHMLRFNVDNSRKIWDLIASRVTRIASMREKFAICLERWSSVATGVARVPGSSLAS